MMNERSIAGQAADDRNSQAQAAAARERQVFYLPPPLGQVMIMAPGLLRTLHQLNFETGEPYRGPDSRQLPAGLSDHPLIWWNADATLGVIYMQRSQELWQMSMRLWLHYLIVQAGEVVLLHFERYGCLPSENEPPLQLRITRAALRRDLGYKSNNNVVLGKMVPRAAELLGSLCFLTREQLSDSKSERLLFPVITDYEYIDSKQGGLRCDIAPQFGQYLLQSGCLTCSKPRSYHFDTRVWRLRGMGSGRKGTLAFGLYMAACNIWNRRNMQNTGRTVSLRYSLQILDQQLPELQRLRYVRGSEAVSQLLRQAVNELLEMQLISQGQFDPDGSITLLLSL